MALLLLLAVLLTLTSSTISFSLFHKLPSTTKLHSSYSEKEDYTWFYENARYYFNAGSDGEVEEMIIPIYTYDDGVVFPTSDVPIHFCVNDDIQMVEYIQSRGKMFGMVLSNGTRICETGTLIENLHRDVFEDNTQACYNVALRRFKIVQVLRQKRFPFMLARVRFNVQDKVDDSELEELQNLEFEVWDLLNEVMQLTNYNSGINAVLTPAVLDNAPSESSSDHEGSSSPALDRTSAFSFAVSDMIAVYSEDRQPMLEETSLLNRLHHVKKMLKSSRDLLYATGWEQSMPAIQCDKEGYTVYKQQRSPLGNQ